MEEKEFEECCSRAGIDLSQAPWVGVRDGLRRLWSATKQPAQDGLTGLEKLGYELDGVIADSSLERFDETCLDTIKRVRAELATLSRAHTAPAGTPAARLHYLLDELAKRFPEAECQFQSDPPEARYLAALDAVLNGTAPVSEQDKRLDWIESQNGFATISKVITWRNGEGEYDGVERTYWEVTDEDGRLFSGTTLRAAIDAAIAGKGKSE